jgi:YacP-like NYN domain
VSTGHFRRIEGTAFDPEVGAASRASAVVLVDAENVRRSTWPNVSLEELVGRARAWAEDAGAEILVVVDGRDRGASGPDVVYTGSESADDWIARRAVELAAASQPYWLVTSDRELRARAGGQAERTIGGGSFLGELLA